MGAAAGHDGARGDGERRRGAPAAGWGVLDHAVLRTMERRQVLRVQRHAALQQLHHAAGALLAERAQEVGAFVRTLNAGDDKTFGRGGKAAAPGHRPDFYTHPSNLISRDAGIRTKREFMANLAGRLREADAAVMQLKPVLEARSLAERSESVKEALRRTLGNREGDKAVPTLEAQRAFSSVAVDVRTPQGRMRARWRDAFLSTLDPSKPDASYNPAAVLTFVDYFCEVLGYDFNVEDDDETLAALHALCEGLVTRAEAPVHGVRPRAVRGRGPEVAAAAGVDPGAEPQRDRRGAAVLPRRGRVARPVCRPEARGGALRRGVAVPDAVCDGPGAGHHDQRGAARGQGDPPRGDGDREDDGRRRRRRIAALARFGVMTAEDLAHHGVGGRARRDAVGVVGARVRRPLRPEQQPGEAAYYLCSLQSAVRL